ncbi:hypothetical protein CBL_12845 [Carabus blaptoides fortunei]
MTAALFKDCFFHHFVPEVKESFKSLGLPEDTKAILLLDNCKAHPPVDERSFIQGLLNADCDVTDFQKKFTVKDVVYAIALSWNQTDEEENHQDALTKVLDVVRSAENPLTNPPDDEVEEWLLIDEIEPVEQELTDEDIINIEVNPQPTQNLE